MELVLGLTLQARYRGTVAGTSVEVCRIETMESLRFQNQLHSLLCALNPDEELCMNARQNPHIYSAFVCASMECARQSELPNIPAGEAL